MDKYLTKKESPKDLLESAPVNKKVCITPKSNASSSKKPDEIINLDLDNPELKRKTYEGRDLPFSTSSTSSKKEKDVTSDQDNKSQPRTRKFQETWNSKFLWLEYDADKDLMFCKLCKAHGKSNKFTEGSDRKREDALVEHLLTTQHKEAEESSIMQKAMKNIVGNLLTKNSKKCMALLQIVYYVVKEDLAFKKFESLAHLVFAVIEGMVDPGDGSKVVQKPLHYINPTGFNGFLSSID